MVKTVVIPADGYGSRMEPLTMTIPKEMFPVGPLPLIEHTILELVASGIKRICVVIRKGKDVIKDYLKGRKALYKEIEFHFAYQEQPLGLRDAMRRAKEFIGGDLSMMAIPDQLLLSEKPATQQLSEAKNISSGIWNSMVRIPKREEAFFRGSRPFECKRLGRGIYSTGDIATDESSSLRGFGRPLYVPEALEYMTKKYINPETSEVDLLKTFHALKSRFPMYGIILKGKPCDIGTWEGYYYYQRRILQHLCPKVDLT